MECCQLNTGSSKVPTIVHGFDSYTSVGMRPVVIVGDSLYWILVGNFVGILEFDLKKQSLAVIQVPVQDKWQYKIWITRTEDGGLGLLLHTDKIFHFWNSKTDSDGVRSWVLG